MNGQVTGNYENFQLNVISALSITSPISADELIKGNANALVNKLYNQAVEQYNKKNKMLFDKTAPVFKDLNLQKGDVIENVMIPFTDGNKKLTISANLKKLIEPGTRELVTQLEKLATLAIIDQAWKEHLREMDDLKQSVQNAVYEQKDPLLVYKFEAFNLFKGFISKINEEIVSFLLRADIPVQNTDDVQEARQTRPVKQVYKENKAEATSALTGRPVAADTKEAEEERPKPIIASKVAGRNDRVSVQYPDGSIKRDVKYKTVEEDVMGNRCFIIED